MKSDIWGPDAWLFLHTITLNYPDKPNEKDKDNYKIFFDSLQNILPCEKCKIHYSENIKKYPIDLESKESLVKWLFNLHNEVNKLNNKGIFNYNDFINKYSNLYNENNKNNKQLLIILGLIILLLIVLYLRK